MEGRSEREDKLKSWTRIEVTRDIVETARPTGQKIQVARGEGIGDFPDSLDRPSGLSNWDEGQG